MDPPTLRSLSTAATSGGAVSMSLSSFETERFFAEFEKTRVAGATRLSDLSPALMRDLLRFGPGCAPGQGLDLVEVMAGALRHGRDVQLAVRVPATEPGARDRVGMLRLLPSAHLAAGPASVLPMSNALAARLTVLHVMPVAVTAGAADPAEPPECRLPLAALAWQLALHGARARLLPEIGGVAAYRATPGADLSGLPLAPAQARAVTELRQGMRPLAEIARLPGLDTESASRLLNALYLQSALMISRSLPGAIAT